MVQINKLTQYGANLIKSNQSQSKKADLPSKSEPKKIQVKI